MNPSNLLKKTIIFAIIFIFSLTLYQTVSAAEYVSLRAYLSGNELPMRTGDAYGPNGCIIRQGDTLETCDVEPGGYMTSTGDLEWKAGFFSPLPAMGMGAPGLGYIPSGYSGITCAAGSSYPGYGYGNSTSDGKICEITFSTSYAASGSAYYYIYVAPGSTRGSRYQMSLTSNGGSNTKNVDFYVRVKPLACTINSFTCSANTLSWSTSNCDTRSINNGVGYVGATGSTAGTGGTTYTMTSWNADSNATSLATCPASVTPAISAKWTENNTTTIIKDVTPGETITVPFEYWNSGDNGSAVNVTECDGQVVSGSVSSNNIKTACSSNYLPK